MANQITMAMNDSIITLYAKGWSRRRIARVLDINRETVARYLRLASKPAILTPGPDPGDNSKPAISTPAIVSPAGRRSQCEPYRDRIITWLDQGLSGQRIYQDLVGEHGFQGAYQSVKRFIRRLSKAHQERFERLECDPGVEAQVDFGRGAMIRTAEGTRRGTWVFRMVLSHSRKGYSEAVLHQTTETFIRCLENAFRYFGGVPQTVVIDNLRAAVNRADWYDPELNPKVAAFCRHYGTTMLPTRPACPRHKGKIERGIGYVKDNALKGRDFDSLATENQHLLKWEQTVADQRIHGTTRQQVGTIFQERERAALQPLPAMVFPCFQEARRSVHRDSFVEVQKAYYEVPEEYIGREVWVRWDARLVHVYNLRLESIAVHARMEPGRFSRQPTTRGRLGGVERTAAYYLKKALLIGPESGAWADQILAQRGPIGIRVLQGLLALTRRYPGAHIEHACEQARECGAFRLRDIRHLLEHPASQTKFSFIDKHPLIRDMAEYGAILEALYPDRFPIPQEVIAHE